MAIVLVIFLGLALIGMYWEAKLLLMIPYTFWLIDGLIVSYYAFPYLKDHFPDRYESMSFKVIVIAIFIALCWLLYRRWYTAIPLCVIAAISTYKQFMLEEEGVVSAIVMTVVVVVLHIISIAHVYNKREENAIE